MKKKIGEVLANGVGRSTALMVSENERGIVRHCFRFHFIPQIPIVIVGGQNASVRVVIDAGLEWDGMWRHFGPAVNERGFAPHRFCLCSSAQVSSKWSELKICLCEGSRVLGKLNLAGKARLDIGGQHMNILSYGVGFASVYPFGCLRGGLSWKIRVLGAVGVVMLEFW